MHPAIIYRKRRDSDNDVWDVFPGSHFCVCSLCTPKSLKALKPQKQTLFRKPGFFQPWLLGFWILLVFWASNNRCSQINMHVSGWLRATAVPAGTAESAYKLWEFCLSVRPSVCPVVTTRYRIKPRWDRDSGFSPYGRLGPLGEEIHLERGHQRGGTP